MPVYFRDIAHQEAINQTIASVKAHSEDYEFIIVDDGSPFDTSFMLYTADTFIRHKVNRGIAPSWNDGIRIARGEYIAIINDDIQVPKNWLSKTREALDIADAGIAAPRVEHLPDKKRGIEEKDTWFPGSCFMLPRTTIEKVGLFDEQFVPFNCEDVDYLHRIKQKGMKLMRNFNVYVSHKEGDVLHKLDYKSVENENVKRLIAKWGTDIREDYY
jgi:GT2 family glycosyltransferase